MENGDSDSESLLDKVRITEFIVENTRFREMAISRKSEYTWQIKGPPPKDGVYWRTLAKDQKGPFNFRYDCLADGLKELQTIVKGGEFEGTQIYLEIIDITKKYTRYGCL